MGAAQRSTEIDMIDWQPRPLTGLEIAGGRGQE